MCSNRYQTDRLVACFLFLRRAYQVAHNDLRASLYSEMQRSEFGCVLHSGINISLHTDQEKHALNVRALHSYMKEVTSLVVNLSRKRKSPTRSTWDMHLLKWNLTCPEIGSWTKIILFHSFWPFKTGAIAYISYQNLNCQKKFHPSIHSMTPWYRCILGSVCWEGVD